MSWLDKVVNLAVQSAGSLIGTRPTVNFTGASVTVTDDSANNRVNVAIASSSAPDATTTTKGLVQLAGDIAGTATSVQVAKVNGVSVSGTPTAGQVITASSGTAAAWATPAAASDATTLAKGIVQLAGDIAGTATSVTVAKVNGVSVTGTPTAGQVITASSGTAAAWATPAAAGASVDVYANRPAAGTAGKIYIPTDGFCSYVDDGSNWRPVIQGVAGVQPPAASAFTAVNCGAGDTITDQNGTLQIKSTTPTGSIPNYHVFVKSISGSSTNFEAICWKNDDMTGWDFPGQNGNMNYSFAGICLRESSSGKIACFFSSVVPSGGKQMFSFEYAASATSSRTIANGRSQIEVPHAGWMSQIYMRLRLAGGTIYAEYSCGRSNFQPVNSVAVSTVFASAPDQVGFACWPFGGSSIASAMIQVPHFAEY